MSVASDTNILDYWMLETVYLFVAMCAVTELFITNRFIGIDFSRSHYFLSCYFHLWSYDLKPDFQQ